MNIFLLIFIIATGLSFIILFFIYLFKNCLFNEINDESIFTNKYFYKATAEPINNQEINLAEVIIIS
jgi:hypothetical protein